MHPPCDSPPPLRLQPTINRLKSPRGLLSPTHGGGGGGEELTSRSRPPAAAADDDTIVWMAESAPLMDLTRGRGNSRESRAVPRLALAGAAQRPASGRGPGGAPDGDAGGPVVEVAFFPWVRGRAATLLPLSVSDSPPPPGHRSNCSGASTPRTTRQSRGFCRPSGRRRRLTRQRPSPRPLQQQQPQPRRRRQQQLMPPARRTLPTRRPLQPLRRPPPRLPSLHPEASSLPRSR